MLPQLFTKDNFPLHQSSIHLGKGYAGGAGVVASRVASAAQFYTDFYSSRGKSLETVTRAVRETVAEAREGFAAPDRAWDMKPEDMTLPA